MSGDAKSWSAITGAPATAGGAVAAEFFEAQLALSASRRVMAALRGLMAGEASPRARLDALTALLAKTLRADACACFLVGPEGGLSLAASTGLPSNAPYPEWAPGEGPVADVASQATPLSIADLSKTAWRAFAFRGFCGVPLLRGGALRGVLAVHTVLPRAYGEEAVEILETVAMIAAEIAATLSPAARRGGAFRFEGAASGAGVGAGHAVLYQAPLPLGAIVADNIWAERDRLRRAVAAMQDAIERGIGAHAPLGGAEGRAILQAYSMFARDRGWLSRIESAIEKGLTAEAAVRRVQDETRARMSAVDDAYIRQRLEDIEDLSNRLLLTLSGPKEAPNPGSDGIVLIAESLGPAALLDYPPGVLKGVVLQSGGRDSHAAILARALGVPFVAGCSGILDAAAPDDRVIVDAAQGVVHLNPSPAVESLYAPALASNPDRPSSILARSGPVVSRDGQGVRLSLNAGLAIDVAQGIAMGAQGVGLFRTELAFMGASRYPALAEQEALYAKILDDAQGRPVVFRTFDLGGDKPLTYFAPPQKEENPALGWRAARIALDRPAVFRVQVRAMIRAARGRPLSIMVPFISDVSEFLALRALAEKELGRAKRTGLLLPEEVQIGVMLEVPSLLWQIEDLAEVADFISVGTNDLTQHLFAADRGNAAVRSRYDTLSPAVLRALKTVAQACAGAEKPATVCGEMAARPLDALALLALGFRSLSAPAGAIAVLQAVVETADLALAGKCLEDALLRKTSPREALLAFSSAHSIDMI